MIPEFDEYGNLPPGVHWATWKELVKRYGTNRFRDTLLFGLRQALLALQHAGCRTVYIDGSFVTANDMPADFDACWEIEDVSLELLDPVLLKFDGARAAQKRKFRGELFPVLPEEESILHVFQQDRFTARPKGIIALDLGVLE